MNEEQTAFIAANKYFTKDICPFGVGVIGSFDENIAKKDSFRLSKLDTDNSWYKIAIPSRENFLCLDNDFKNSSSQVKEKLFSHEAMSMLYFDEGKIFFKQLEEFINSKPEEERVTLAKESINNFYLEKQEELLKLGSVSSVIDFITQKSRPKDISIASSFLSKFGITGVIFSETNLEKFLIFDAKNNIRIQNVFFDKL